MTPVDLTKWPRKAVFEFYRDFDYPQINVCVDIDVTSSAQYLEVQNLSKFKTILWAISHVSNSIDELKYRIRNGDVILHDRVHPSFTVLTEDNLFAFCLAEYTQNIRIFFDRVEKGIQECRVNPSLEDEPGQDDILYVSCLPWIHFTSISHPIKLDAQDAIPRISWGRFKEDKGKIVMPLAVQVHHGLADGYHLGKFFNRMQELVNNPAKLFEN
ncbi:MAG: chloramphenicol acetyltransferase [Desulfobacterales bacterium]|jgi:chloramphenicol O-acetyltransferase type A